MQRYINFLYFKTKVHLKEKSPQLFKHVIYLENKRTSNVITCLALTYYSIVFLFNKCKHSLYKNILGRDNIFTYIKKDVEMI